MLADDPYQRAESSKLDKSTEEEILMKKFLIAVFAILAIGTFATASFAASGAGSGSRYSAYGGNTGGQNQSWNDHSAGNYQSRR